MSHSVFKLSRVLLDMKGTNTLSCVRLSSVEYFHFGLGLMSNPPSSSRAWPNGGELTELLYFQFDREAAQLLCCCLEKGAFSNVAAGVGVSPHYLSGHVSCFLPAVGKDAAQKRNDAVETWVAVPAVLAPPSG